MSKPKSDADILALFDRISAEVKRAGPGSKRARAIAPAFHADQNEWSELELSNMIGAELEERAQWRLTGAVLLREEQRCMCGGAQQNTLGIFAREVHRNGCVKLRKPRPEDYMMLEVLERHIEWAPVTHVTNCAECFEWGERRLQAAFPFENQGVVPPEVQELADLTIKELYSRPEAEPHSYFKENSGATTNSNATESGDVEEGGDRDAEAGDVDDVFDFIEKHDNPE